MPASYIFKEFPKSRIATFDTFAVGLARHHIAAMLEFDVTEGRKKLREARQNGKNISFNAWLLKAIANTIETHPEASAYLYYRKKLIIFNDINISVLVEKKVGESRVPIPLVIDRVNEKTAFEITTEIENAVNDEITGSDIVLNKKPSFSEKLYYYLPGLLRRFIWRRMLGNPKFVFTKMGSAAVTSVGVIGRINGWFIHKSIHPLSFGIGSVLKKPVAINDEVKIREILNMTILLDHDVIDGAPMVRFLKALSRSIEIGDGIDD